nr:hypothetical protein GCM10020093_053010 [Planobispora longispora]
MLLAEQRRLLCDYGRRAAATGLVVGAAGNLSVRAGDLIAVTPGGVPSTAWNPTPAR